MTGNRYKQEVKCLMRCYSLHCIHAYVVLSVHEDTRGHIHTCIIARTCTHTHTHIGRDRQSHTHKLHTHACYTQPHACMHTHTLTYTLAHTHTHTSTHTHTHAHAHAHAHAHVDTQLLVCKQLISNFHFELKYI